MIETFIDVSDPLIKCVVCEKTFTNMQNARRHVRTLHLHSGTEIGLKCDICQHDHMRTKHNVYKKGKYNTDYRG